MPGELFGDEFPTRVLSRASAACPGTCRTNLHQRFVEALEQQKPEVMQALEADRQAKQRKVRLVLPCCVGLGGSHIGFPHEVE